LIEKIIAKISGKKLIGRIRKLHDIVNNLETASSRVLGLISHLGR